jgi:hypothetical protein
VIKREYHAHVSVHKKGSSGGQYSDHSFTFNVHSWRAYGANKLYHLAVGYAIQESMYSDNHDAVIVKSLSRLK